MNQDEQMTARVQAAEQTGHEFGISMTVVGELFFAIHAGQRYLRNRQRLAQLLNAFQIYPFDQEAAEEFGRIQAAQKAKGRPIPPLDAQIAAVARRHAMTILTADKHFDMIDGAVVENWMAG